MSAKRKQHSPTYKSQVALEALKEEMTIGQVSSKFGIHPTQIRRWRDHLKLQLPVIFKTNPSKELVVKEELIEQLYNQIGKLTYELDWLKKKLGVVDK